MHVTKNGKTRMVMQAVNCIQCSNCQIVISQRSNFMKHKCKKHLLKEVLNLPCTKGCKRTFGSSWNLEQHERNCTGQLDVICGECSATFKTQASLFMHMSIHKSRKIGLPKCEMCKQIFVSKENLK